MAHDFKMKDDKWCEKPNALSESRWQSCVRERCLPTSGQCFVMAAAAGVPCAPPPPLWDIPSGCCFFTGALDSHPFFPSHVASGRCVLSAAAAGAPAGVVSAFAEPRGWCAGAVLDVAGCAVCASAEPSSWCAGAVLDVAGCAVCASAVPSSWRIGGCAGCCGGRLTVFAVHTPPSSGRPPPASLCSPAPV